MIDRIKLLLIQKWVAFVVSGALLFVAITLVIIFSYPVDILKSWTLTITNDHSYRVGDTLLVRSEFEKTRDVAARSSRYLECREIGSAGFTRYPINERQGAASQPPGEYFGDRAIEIPVIIQTIPTPSRCRLAVEAHYRLWLVRDVVEKNVTNEFEVQ